MWRPDHSSRRDRAAGGTSIIAMLDTEQHARLEDAALEIAHLRQLMNEERDYFRKDNARMRSMLGKPARSMAVAR